MNRLKKTAKADRMAAAVRPGPICRGGGRPGFYPKTHR